MKIYLAGPVVTNDAKIKAEMDCLATAIKQMSHSIPLLNDGGIMRDDVLELYRPGKHKVPNAWGIDMQTWGQCVFTMDVIAIDKCDWMVLADYGRQATSGTSWEAGYAFAKGVKILVVQMPEVKESSLMTQGCAANICKYEDFIAGIDQETDEDEQLDSTRWQKFFFERGRKAQNITLN